MPVAKSPVVKTIEVPPIRIVKMALKIKGESPLVTNRFSEKAKR